MVLIVNGLTDSTCTGMSQTPGAPSIGSGLTGAGLPQQQKSPVASPTSSNPQSPQLSPTIRSGSSSKCREGHIIMYIHLCYCVIPTAL